MQLYPEPIIKCSSCYHSGTVNTVLTTSSVKLADIHVQVHTHTHLSTHTDLLCVYTSSIVNVFTHPPGVSELAHDRLYSENSYIN